MQYVFQVLALAAFLYLVLLFARIVISFITVLARDWKPTGVVVVALEGVFTSTDPPVRAARRLIKPLRIGSVQLDLAFMVVFFLTWILYSVFRRLSGV